MATVVATTPAPDISEAQQRLQQAIGDVTRRLLHPNKAELTAAVDDLDKRWVEVSKELRALARPLTVRPPRLVGEEPAPTPERLAQQQAIEQVCKLLDAAREARTQALMALFRLG